MLGLVQGTGTCDAGSGGRLLCITCSFWWGYTRRSRTCCGEQGLAIEEITPRQEGLDGQTGHRGIVHLATRERIEHPCGNRELKTILEFDDQTLRVLPS